MDKPAHPPQPKLLNFVVFSYLAVHKILFLLKGLMIKYHSLLNVIVLGYLIVKSVCSARRCIVDALANPPYGD